MSVHQWQDILLLNHLSTIFFASMHTKVPFGCCQKIALWALHIRAHSPDQALPGLSISGYHRGITGLDGIPSHLPISNMILSLCSGRQINVSIVSIESLHFKPIRRPDIRASLADYGF